MTSKKESIEDFTTIQEARPGSKSVRITIPEIIADAANLAVGNRMRWRYDRETGDIILRKG